MYRRSLIFSGSRESLPPCPRKVGKRSRNSMTQRVTSSTNSYETCLCLWLDVREAKFAAAYRRFQEKPQMSAEFCASIASSSDGLEPALTAHEVGTTVLTQHSQNSSFFQGIEIRAATATCFSTGKRFLSQFRGGV